MEPTVIGAFVSGGVAILGGLLKLIGYIKKLQLDAQLAQQSGSSETANRTDAKLWKIVENLESERDDHKADARAALAEASNTKADLEKLQMAHARVLERVVNLEQVIERDRTEIAELKTTIERLDQTK